MKSFKTIPSPFGTGIDEQATTAAFENYVGGVSKAQQLFRIYKESYPSARWGHVRGMSKIEVFCAKAKNAGFNQAEIDAACLVFRG